jgi:hypothetical protein
MVILLLPPRHRLSNPAMIRADVIASSHKKDSGHDGRDVDALRHTHQKLSSKYTVAQKQRA